MATKKICDRCGAEINPPSAITYAMIRRSQIDIPDEEYELCASCAQRLREWFNGGKDGDDNASA